VRYVLFIIVFLIEVSSSLSAHTIRPAYLEVFATAEKSYAIKWKVPIEEKITLDVMPKFPKGCISDKESFYKVYDKDIILSYWTLTCREPLLGKEITIDNIKKDKVEVLFYFKQDDVSYFYKINSKNSIAKIDNKTENFTVIKEYTFLGIKHILLGYDHLLFVLGLLFIVVGWRMLIKTITSFTLAHSITLGLSILGYAVVDTKFIEALIALSIVILAVEIIYVYHGKKGLLSKYPWIIAFFFGLIHGFGFAFVLIELGLPQSQLTLALLFFNVGIEVGQLLFIGVMIFLYFLLKNFFSNEKLLRGKVFVVYLIGSLASYWLIERMVL
jgi:hypothetical protein